MSFPVNVDDRRLDGSFDLALFGGFPIYFFNLEPVLAHTRSALARDPERLRSVCEQHLGALVTSEVLIFSGSGFYLVVQSCPDAAALGLANRVNLSLRKLFFGTDNLVPNAFATMFEGVRSAESKSASNNFSHTAKSGQKMAAPLVDDAPGVSAEKRVALVQLASQGRLPEQNVELSFVPVYDLRNHRVSAFFCSPVAGTLAASRIYGYRAFQGMSRHEWPLVDRAILAYAIKFARKLTAGGIVAAVGTSVNFETLAWSQGRKIYCQALRAIGAGDFPFLILKIENVPAGTLPGRIAEIVSSVRPLAKRVFVHLPNCDIPIHQCGHLGASGFVLSLPSRPMATTASGISNWLVRTCEIQSALSCIDHIDNEATLARVRQAGVRFGAGQVFGAREFRGDAEAAAVEAFMDEVGHSAPKSHDAPNQQRSVVAI
jgi:hypothetical protein